MSMIVGIPIDRIQVGEYDQRLQTEDESIDGLASSISRIGLVYPCVVVSDGDKFNMVEGHRRLAACKRLGKQTINCLVKDPEKDATAEVAFAGNFFRKDLSPVELAAALKDCIDKKNMDIRELAAGFHKKEHWVSRMIAIASWPADIQKAIHEKLMSVSAANNLALVTDDAYRAFLVRNAVEAGATARTTASWLQAWRAMQPQEEAIASVPVEGAPPVAPMIPQAPCFCCSQLFEVNKMSHIPVCGACVQILRAAGPQS